MIPMGKPIGYCVGLQQGQRCTDSVYLCNHTRLLQSKSIRLNGSCSQGGVKAPAHAARNSASPAVISSERIGVWDFLDCCEGIEFRFR